MNKIAMAPTSLPNTPPMDYVAAAATAGYEAIGLRVYRSPGLVYSYFPIAGDQALMRDVRKSIADSGMEVVDILSFYLQPEMSIDAMMAPLEFGASLGASYALVIGDDDDWNRQVDNFGRLCDVVGKLNLTASLEAPVNSRKVNSFEKALKLIADSGRQNAVICLDPFQFLRANDSVDMIKAQDPRLFPYTQITDGYMTGPRLGMGAGAVPLKEIMDALPQELPLSLEWPAPPNTSYEPAVWAKTALDGCKAWLKHYYQAKA